MALLKNQAVKKRDMSVLTLHGFDLGLHPRTEDIPVLIIIEKLVD